MLFIILSFLIFRAADLVIVSFATKIIPCLGRFAYIEVVRDSNLPRLISSLANFDGVYYIRIAIQGYSQYEQAFFPLYPMLIKILSPIFANNHLLAGLVISNVSFLLGLIVFIKYLKTRGVDDEGKTRYRVSHSGGNPPPINRGIPKSFETDMFAFPSGLFSYWFSFQLPSFSVRYIQKGYSSSWQCLLSILQRKRNTF